MTSCTVMKANPTGLLGFHFEHLGVSGLHVNKNL